MAVCPMCKTTAVVEPVRFCVWSVYSTSYERRTQCEEKGKKYISLLSKNIIYELLLISNENAEYFTILWYDILKYQKNGFEIETGRAQVALPLYRRYI